MSICDGDLVDSNNSFAKQREKIIIDTDPGIGKKILLTLRINLFKVGNFSKFLQFFSVNFS